jgi:hypothetical protein
VLSHRAIVLGTLVTLISATAGEATSQSAPMPATVVRITSGTPGHEVRVRGVLLVFGQPMQVVEQATPFEFRSARPLVFAAFEPAELEGMLRLELLSQTPEPAVITAPRVLVGQRIGGVASEFVQGY